MNNIQSANLERICVCVFFFRSTQPLINVLITCPVFFFHYRHQHKITQLSYNRAIRAHITVARETNTRFTITYAAAQGSATKGDVLEYVFFFFWFAPVGGTVIVILAFERASA